MRISKKKLLQAGFVEIVPGIWEKRNQFRNRICRDESQSNVKNTLGKKKKRKEKNSVPNCTKITIVITRYSQKTLDYDNLVASYKYVIDALIYYTLIPDDSPDFVKLIYKQIQSNQNKTEVKIYY